MTEKEKANAVVRSMVAPTGNEAWLHHVRMTVHCDGIYTIEIGGYAHAQKISICHGDVERRQVDIQFEQPVYLPNGLHEAKVSGPGLDGYTITATDCKTDDMLFMSEYTGLVAVVNEVGGM